MISSEVQRTLVKSPPELWAEISDPESLARHLGEFGEIRITRVQPEQKVEWEADDASGTVVIKPSGWGTKVKLTVTRELTEPEPADDSAAQADYEQASAHDPEQADYESTHEVESAQDVELESDPAGATALAQEPQGAAELDDELEADIDDTSAPSAAVELEPPSDHGTPVETVEETEAESDEPADTQAQAEPVSQPEPEPRRGFFARLFGRRRARPEERPTPLEPSRAELVEPIASEPIDDEALPAELDVPKHDFELLDEPALEREPVSSAADEPAEIVVQPLSEPAPGTAAHTAEPTIGALEDGAEASTKQVAIDRASSHAKLAEELATEEVTAVLTGVLDRLGAAHHRPFSRA